MGRLTTRSRALLVLLCLALCACERVGANSVRSNALAERILGLPDDSTTGGGTTAAATGSGTTAANTDTNTATNTNTANTDTTSTQATTTQQETTTTQQTTSTQNTQTTQNTATNTQATSTQQTNTETTGNTNTNTQQQNTQTTQAPASSTDTVVSTSTDANGSVVVVTTVITPSPDTSTGSATSAAESSSSTSSSDDGGGIGTGSIIGMSVAGGVAVIGVISFFIWKFTRKRYSDFDDEPIKWPELNAHNNDNLNYALPTTRDAGAGAGAGLDSASEVNLARGPSAFSQPSQYSQPSAADSTADLYAPGGDPYAVPPLPHLNPNQPYRDDPAFGSNPAYYDPYRGPVPQTFNDGASMHSTGFGGEAIPMSNLAGGPMPAGRRSPGPQMGLDMGRASPAPAMSGRQSPGPSLGYSASNASSAYTGRASPGPGMAMSGRQSPGPGGAYGGGTGY